MALTVDPRTASEYGVVRTFAQGDFQFQNFGTQNGATPSSGPGGGIDAAGSSGNTGFLTAGQLSGLSNALLSNPGGGYVAVEYVFIQFAGFTFGKSSSAYSSPSGLPLPTISAHAAKEPLRRPSERRFRAGVAQITRRCDRAFPVSNCFVY
jgi:hypothetical protein